MKKTPLAAARIRARSHCPLGIISDHRGAAPRATPRRSLMTSLWDRGKTFGFFERARVSPPRAGNPLVKPSRGFPTRGEAPGEHCACSGGPHMTSAGHQNTKAAGPQEPQLTKILPLSIFKFILGKSEQRVGHTPRGTLPHLPLFRPLFGKISFSGRDRVAT